MYMSDVAATSMLSNPRVLLIEDDEAVARTFLRGIERAGMTVQWANTGMSGMALKETFKPQIVLMDLTLPDMNGMLLIGKLAQCGSRIARTARSANARKRGSPIRPRS